MRTVVGDLEANGLLDTATVLHCGVFKDVVTGEVFKFPPNEVYKIPDFLAKTDTLIMHNGVGFDIPLMRKLLGYTYKGQVIDTLIMSRVLNPNRPVPFDCPYKKAPHSVEAWGHRVGRGKPEHHDWEHYSEAMLHRCSEDVEIQTLIYNELVKEAEAHGGWFDKPYRPMAMTHKLFTILQEQEEYGWLFDKQHANRCIQHLGHIIDTIAYRLAPKLPLRLICLEKKAENNEQYWKPLVLNLGLASDNADCMSFVRSPFLKSGKLNQHVSRYLESSGHIGRIVGPHSRINIRPVDVDSADELKTLLLSLGWEPAQWNTDAEGNRTSPKLTKDDPFDGLKTGIGKMIAKRVQCKHRRSQIEVGFLIYKQMGGYMDVSRDSQRLEGPNTRLLLTCPASKPSTERRCEPVSYASQVMSSLERTRLVAKIECLQRELEMSSSRERYWKERSLISPPYTMLINEPSRTLQESTSPTTTQKPSIMPLFLAPLLGSLVGVWVGLQMWVN